MGKIINRNHTLDVIRAFLSWVVFAVHVVWFSGYRGNTQEAIGAYAVDGFIILSGFVITQLLVVKKEAYGVFIFRRFMRLFPAFAVCIALSLLVRPLTLGRVSNQLVREVSETQFFWWHLGAHAGLIHGLVPTAWLPESQFAFLPPGWSISLEFQLYLVAPFVLWFIARFGVKGFAFLAFASAIMLLPQFASRLSHVWSGAGAFLPQRFLFFLIGMKAFEIFGRGLGSSVQFWPGFVRLGEVSYSTYLVHWPVLASLNAVLPREMPALEQVGILFLFGAPITLLFSFLLFQFVERPGIALGRRLTKESSKIAIEKPGVVVRTP